MRTLEYLDGRGLWMVWAPYMELPPDALLWRVRSHGFVIMDGSFEECEEYVSDISIVGSDRLAFSVA